MSTKVLITKAVFTNLATFYCQTENGEILPNCQGFPDDDGNVCLMQVFPSHGFEGMSLDEVESKWAMCMEPKPIKLIEVDLSGLESDSIQNVLPKTATRWFIESQS